MQYSFQVTSDAFSGPAARYVVVRHDNFQPGHADALEGKTDGELRCPRGDALALSGLAYPIAQVGKAVLPVALVHAHATQQAIGLRVDDQHLAALVQQPRLAAEGDPGFTCGRVVTGLAPVLPAPDS